MTRRIVMTAACLLILASRAGAAPILVLLNGRIATADGVVVGGKTYDVDFLDGFCNDVFGGCNASTAFAFDTIEKAQAASQALLDTVFLNFGTAFETQFDSRPSLTNGCSVAPPGSTIFFRDCRIRTPYAIKVGTNVNNVVVLDVLAVNNDNDFVKSNSAIDVTVFPDGQTFPQADFLPDQNYTWARWRLRSTDGDGDDGTPGTVPEPATLSLLGLGLAGATLRLRRSGARKRTFSAGEGHLRCLRRSES
jgi:hypothetical protein